jgi:hypothetical protein
LVDPALLAPLQADLQNVAPHFVDASEANRQTLTPEEQKIKDDVIALFAARQSDNQQYYSGIWLDAVGKRYVLVSQPSADSAYDVVVDSKTGSTAIIPNGASYASHYLPLERQDSEGRHIALYIGYQDLYTYTLDQGSFVLVPGSKLSGSETYHSGRSDFRIDPEETHVGDSITISVFDSSQIVQNPDAQENGMQTMSKKVREVTLPF